MKKLFISCPMKGRTDANIRDSMERMHKIAELVFDQELEVIPTYIKDAPLDDVNYAIWYLGESIKKMSSADYFIGIGYSEVFKGCMIEAGVAQQYGIPHTFVSVVEMMPDANDIEKTYYEERTRDKWEG